MKDQDITYYLNGEGLYGDDFLPEDVQSWFADEREGYFQLVPRDPKTYRYEYHAVNWIHGFSQLPDIHFNHVLGMGAAYGDEFLPIISRISRIAILEPSQ